LPTEIGTIVKNGIRETPEEKIYAAYIGTNIEKPH
jgi:hypothetical protein